MRSLGKIFSLIFFALLGVCLGLVFSASVMIMEVDGSDMLPSLEPGEKVLVLRRDFAGDYAPGDLVVYETPYYTAYGGGSQLIRRVGGVRGNWIRLTCDASTTRSREVLAEEEELAGKVIFNFSTMKKP